MANSRPQSTHITDAGMGCPSRVRHGVVLCCALMSVLLYLDRFCVSFAADYIREDLSLTQEQMGYFFSAFFFSYALAQVPSGWISDRFGARLTLVVYILVWSFFTALVGVVHSLALLILARIGCGLGQAGAYPTSASIISKWVPFQRRGTSSAIVALGGRCGGAIAPLLTAFLIVAFVGTNVPVEFQSADLLHAPRLCARIAPLQPESKEMVEGPNSAGEQIWSLLSPDEQRAFAEEAESYRWLEKRVESDRVAAGNEVVLLSALNRLITIAELYDERAFKSAKLPREAIGFLKRKQSEAGLGEQDLRRLNRLLLEGAFPGEIGKLYVLGWRPVMYVYGAAGLFVALLFWIVFRNHPAEHPHCNAAERALIETGRPPGAPGPHGKPGKIPLGRLIRSGSMWLDCFLQLGTNIGWLFLVTWLPRYLISVHQVPILERGMMAMTPLLTGIVGMYAGGRLTDVLAHKLGLRWGRCLPMALTRFTAAGAYGLCFWFSTFPESSPWNSPWAFIAAFSLVSFSTDMGSPAAWAFKQDVGGRYVGSVLGWGNMWGNLGATISPLIYNHFLGETPKLDDWNAMFLVCMSAFLLAGLCGLGIDATKPIAPPDEEHGDDH